MTKIIDEPHAYEVHRNGEVIGVAMLCQDGIWRSAGTTPESIRRHPNRAEAVAAIKRTLVLEH